MKALVVGAVVAALVAPSVHHKPRPAPTPSATTSTAPVVASAARGTGGVWVTKFVDTFDGTTLNTSKWRPNWLGGADTQITKGANGAETACMAPGNVTVSGGAAHLALTAQSTSCNGTTKPHRGAMIQTGSDNIVFRPATCGGECYFEAVLRLPATSSYVKNWPAFWTNGHNVTWPTGGENDVMEGLCDTCPGTGEVAATYHYYSGSTWGAEPVSQTAFRDNGWHTYASQWSADGTVRWYYDGVLIGTITGAETWADHFVILDYTAGTWGGPTQTGNVMDVDRVEVFGRS